MEIEAESNLHLPSSIFPQNPYLYLMFYLFFLLFILLCFALLFSVMKTGAFKNWAKIFRIAVVIVTTGVFTYYFITKSLSNFLEDSLTVQLVNKLPFPLDFYIVKVTDDNQYKTQHLGSIRSNFYRIEYLDMDHSDEFWVAGYMGKKNLAYFSQHSVPNKNMDQIIEVNNYIIQSAKLSSKAKTLIDEMKLENIKTSVWITLDLLLLYLNFALLFRRAKTKKIPS